MGLFRKYTPTGKREHAVTALLNARLPETDRITGKKPIQSLDFVNQLVLIAHNGQDVYRVDTSNRFSRKNFTQLGLEEGRDFSVEQYPGFAFGRRFYVNQEALEKALGMNPQQREL